MPGSLAPTPDPEDARARAGRVGAAVARWVRQNPPGGRWHTWVFTAEDQAESIGPRADELHLSPGAPTEHRVLEAVVRRTSGIRSTGRGLALAFPASLRDGGRGRAPAVVPRRSGADPLPGTSAVVAVVVQLDDPDARAVVVDHDAGADHPVASSGPDGSVTFPGPDVVPAFLRRAVLGDTGPEASALPSPQRLRVQGWVATVIHASLQHGSTSQAVEVALDAAPSPEDVRGATLEQIHDLVLSGELPGLRADLARWCGPALTAQVVAGVYGQLPDMIRYADEHWPTLGATLGRRTRELLGGTT